MTESGREHRKQGSIVVILFTSLLVLGAFAAAILALSLTLAYTSLNVPSVVLAYDIQVYRGLVLNQQPALTSLIFTLFNDPGIDYSVPIAACLAYLWWKQRHRMPAAAIAIALAMVIGAATIPYTQYFGFRPRPFMVVTEVVIDPYWRQVWSAIPTFPSGHVRELAGICLVLGYYWRSLRPFTAAYLLLVASTRVYMGAHFPTDVIAGLMVGLSAGTLSILTVDRAEKMVRLANERMHLSRMAGYLTGASPAGSSSTRRLVLVVSRVSLAMGALVALGLALGSIIYITEPRILADYLRNTDNSVAFALLARFDTSVASFLYALFGGEAVALIVVALCLVTINLFRNDRPGVLRSLMALGAAYLLVQILITVVSVHFQRPSPALTNEVRLPERWLGLLPQSASFPDAHILLLTSFATLLSRRWKPLLVPANIYAIAAAAAWLYLGASWPTDLAATLVMGYFVGRTSLFLSNQIAALLEGGRHDHTQGLRYNAAEQRRRGEGLTIRMDRQGKLG